MMDRNQSAFTPAPKLLTAAPVLRQPVSLEVPVRLQGEPNGHATFFEDTNTVLVFREGAVLRVGGQLLPGQTVLLTNRATRQQAPCRVSYVKQHGSVRGYAEVEFAAPAPGFWDETPAAARMDAPAASQSALTPPMHSLASATPAAVLRATESFAQLDNIAEAVEMAPRRPMPQAIVLPEQDTGSRSPAKITPVAAPLTLAPAPVDEIEQMLAFKRGENDAQAQEAALAASAFAENLLDPAAHLPFAPTKNKNRVPWIMSAVAAAALLTTGLVLGNWGLQGNAGGMVLAAPAVPEPPKWAVANLFRTSESIATLPLRTPHNRDLFLVMQPASIRKAAELRQALSHGKTATPAPAQRLMVEDSAVPEIAGGGPAVAAPLSLIPTAPAQVAAPLAPVESKLEPLRLIFSVKPDYPLIARQTRTQGEVLIHAHVDETGKIAQMRILSGPPSLRQAALQALAQWKYAPARLNGKPVAVDTTVSVKFQL